MTASGIKAIKPEKLPFKFNLVKGAKYLKGFFISSSGFSCQSS
jgi:hypothetical protein